MALPGESLPMPQPSQIMRRMGRGTRRGYSQIPAIWELNSSVIVSEEKREGPVELEHRSALHRHRSDPFDGRRPEGGVGPPRDADGARPGGLRALDPNSPPQSE